jgi:hypothetical protein
VAAISPAIAVFLGFPPFPVLVPFIIAGNVVLILTWYFILKIPFLPKKAAGGALLYITAVVAAAAIKFGTLYLGINIIAPNLLGIKLPPPILAAFSVQQLFTALMGGGLSLAVIPAFKKTINREV